MNASKAVLREIAVHIANGNRGDFLKAVANAYLGADQENERTLRPAWIVLIDKYGLDKERYD